MLAGPKRSDRSHRGRRALHRPRAAEAGRLVRRGAGSPAPVRGLAGVSLRGFAPPSHAEVEVTVNIWGTSEEERRDVGANA